MSNELNKRLATFHALWELKEAVAQDDLRAAQECRDKRLILALDLFSGIGNDVTRFNEYSL
jgi:hypothetical protein